MAQSPIELANMVLREGRWRFQDVDGSVEVTIILRAPSMADWWSAFGAAASALSDYPTVSDKVEVLTQEVKAMAVTVEEVRTLFNQRMNEAMAGMSGISDDVGKALALMKAQNDQIVQLKADLTAALGNSVPQDALDTINGMFDALTSRFAAEHQRLADATGTSLPDPAPQPTDPAPVDPNAGGVDPAPQPTDPAPVDPNVGGTDPNQPAPTPAPEPTPQPVDPSQPTSPDAATRARR